MLEHGMPDEEFDETVFARQKERAERTMKKVVVVLMVVVLASLYFLLQGG
jgi:hypothetical protein